MSLHKWRGWNTAKHWFCWIPRKRWAKMVSEVPKMIVLWNFCNWIQAWGEFGRLAESFALRFSGRAAACPDEPPVLLTKKSLWLGHQGNCHLAKSTMDCTSLRELIVQFKGLWTWETKSCYCHTFILAVMGRLKSEVTIEIVFNILVKGRTYLDAKSWLYLFGFVVYWSAWV